MSGTPEFLQPHPEQPDNLDVQVQNAMRENYSGFLKARGITEASFLKEYGIDISQLKEHAEIQDDHQYIMFYMKLFNKTTTDPRPVSERTPSYPVLFSLVNLLPETGDALDGRSVNILAEEYSSLALGALMAVCAGDPDLPLAEFRDIVVVKLLDKLPSGERATSEALIRKEYVISSLISYMMFETEIGLHPHSPDFLDWDYAAAGNAVLALVQRYRDELDTLPLREAQAWRRHKYIFSPGFEEDLQHYIDPRQQSQSEAKVREAETNSRRQAVRLTDAHFAKLSDLLGIKGLLPEKYRALLERSLTDLKERPSWDTPLLDNVEADIENFLIELVFHVALTPQINENQFVTRQFPLTRGIRLVFGGKHLGNFVLWPEHYVLVEGEFIGEPAKHLWKKIN